MKFVWFVHAIASCWNNGNAHFLRGLALALQDKGHEVVFCEAEGSWSETNLIDDHGADAVLAFDAQFPTITRTRYQPATVDLEALTDGADVVIVHEWNEPQLIKAIGKLERRFTLLFHDTHHRAVTDPDAMMWDEIAAYDGALVFGEAIAEVYRSRGWAKRVFTLHEAADTRTFHPETVDGPKRDLIWIGNWGDDERSAELHEFLIEPAHALTLSATVFGVRYPGKVVRELRDKGIDYRGWLPNHRAPEEFARHRFTVHVPRGPYARQLPGIPTIRVFEALACGIPLISSPWQDSENLFPPGCFLMAKDGAEMRRHMQAVRHDRLLREDMIAKGLQVIRERHSCDHRADQLVEICRAVADKEGLAQCA